MKINRYYSIWKVKSIVIDDCYKGGLKVDGCLVEFSRFGFIVKFLEIKVLVSNFLVVV